MGGGTCKEVVVYRCSAEMVLEPLQRGGRLLGLPVRRQASGHGRSSLYRANRHARILPVSEPCQSQSRERRMMREERRKGGAGFELTEALGGCLIFGWQVPATYRRLAPHPFAPLIW